VPHTQLQPPSGVIHDGAHYFPLRVYFEDTDLSGVVYHANYLRYCERARSDFMLLLGLDHRAAFETGQGYFAVAEARIKYLKPAKLDDALVVISQFTELRAVSWRVHQRVIRDGQEIAHVDILAAFLDMRGRPTRQPAHWTESYKTILKEAS